MIVNCCLPGRQAKKNKGKRGNDSLIKKTPSGGLPWMRSDKSTTAGRASISQNHGLRHKPVDCSCKNQYKAISNNPALYKVLDNTKPANRHTMAV